MAQVKVFDMKAKGHGQGHYSTRSLTLSVI